MLLLLTKNGLTSLFEEVRVFKVVPQEGHNGLWYFREIISQMALQRCNVVFFQISGSNFGRSILRCEFLEGEFLRGPLFCWKTGFKVEPRIRVQNLGVQNLGPRIRPQIRVSEAQNPLCRNLSLRNLRGS